MRVVGRRAPTPLSVRASPLRAGLRAAGRWGIALVLLAPGFGVYATFVLFPLAATLWTSLHRWTGFTEPQWTGAGNYRLLAGDPLFWRALSNNLLFVPFYVALPMALGLLLAALLATPGLRGRTGFRMLLFLPQVMPVAVVGLVWRWMLNPAFGPVNALLRAVGLGSWSQPWLGSFTWALPSVGLVATWVYCGFCMVLFLAGLQRLDPSLFDAAAIDGATWWQRFVHITWPLLRPEAAVAALFTLVAALKVFDLVFVMTRGGPGNSTLVVSLYLYRNVFEQNRVGYGAAMAVVLTLLVVAASTALRRVRQEAE